MSERPSHRRSGADPSNAGRNNAPLPGTPVAVAGQADREGRARLIDACDEVLDADAEKRAAAPAPRSRFGHLVKPGLALGLALTSAYLWFGVPGWLWPPGATIEAPITTEEEVRSSLLFLASQIETFRLGAGRPPASLEEAGLRYSWINYASNPEDQRYVITTAPGTPGGTWRVTSLGTANGQALIRIDVSQDVPR